MCRGFFSGPEEIAAFLRIFCLSFGTCSKEKERNVDQKRCGRGLFETITLRRITLFLYSKWVEKGSFIPFPESENDAHFSAYFYCILLYFFFAIFSPTTFWPCNRIKRRKLSSRSSFNKLSRWKRLYNAPPHPVVLFKTHFPCVIIETEIVLCKSVCQASSYYDDSILDRQDFFLNGNNKKHLIDRLVLRCRSCMHEKSFFFIAYFLSFIFCLFKDLESVAPILKSSHPATCANRIFSILSSLCTTVPANLSRLNVLLSSDLSRKIR